MHPAGPQMAYYFMPTAEPNVAKEISIDEALARLSEAYPNPQTMNDCIFLMQRGMFIPVLSGKLLRMRSQNVSRETHADS